MQDIKLQKTKYGYYDFVINGNSLDTVDGFETAILVSLFTNARASKTQVKNAIKRNGWVGNILVQNKERQLGGLLWLLEQSKLTQDTLNFFNKYVKDSLKWLIDDGLLKDIKITTEIIDTESIRININLETITNQIEQYTTLWSSTDLRLLTIQNPGIPEIILPGYYLNFDTLEFQFMNSQNTNIIFR